MAGRATRVLRSNPVVWRSNPVGWQGHRSLEVEARKGPIHPLLPYTVQGRIDKRGRGGEFPAVESQPGTQGFKVRFAHLCVRRLNKWKPLGRFGRHRVHRKVLLYALGDASVMRWDYLAAVPPVHLVAVVLF